MGRNQVGEAEGEFKQAAVQGEGGVVGGASRGWASCLTCWLEQGAVLAVGVVSL